MRNSFSSLNQIKKRFTELTLNKNNYLYTSGDAEDWPIDRTILIILLCHNFVTAN